MTPLERWGADHWSLLLVVEGAQVRRSPTPIEHLRVRPDHADRARALGGGALAPWDPAIASRCHDGTLLQGHDDLDCLDDLAAAGVIDPVALRLTDLGWRLAGEARRHAAAHGVVDGFRPALPFGCPSSPPKPVTVDELRVERDEVGHVDLAARGLRLCCRKVEGRWTCVGMTTVEAGHQLDGATVEGVHAAASAWLAAHYPIDGASAPTEPTRCPKCGRRFGQRLLVTWPAPVARVVCGPVHVFHHADGGIVLVERGVARVKDHDDDQGRRPLDRLPRPPTGR